MPYGGARCHRHDEVRISHSGLDAGLVEVFFPVSCGLVRLRAIVINQCGSRYRCCPEHALQLLAGTVAFSLIKLLVSKIYWLCAIRWSSSSVYLLPHLLMNRNTLLTTEHEFASLSTSVSRTPAVKNKSLAELHHFIPVFTLQLKAEYMSQMHA